MSRTRNYLVALGVSALASVATIAGAADFASAGDPPSLTVRYADLDLQTAKGVSTLYRRLTTAAGQVCPQASTADLYRLSLSQQCQKAAVQRAVSAVGSPMLARVATDHGVSNN